MKRLGSSKVQNQNPVLKVEFFCLLLLSFTRFQTKQIPSNTYLAKQNNIRNQNENKNIGYSPKTYLSSWRRKNGLETQLENNVWEMVLDLMLLDGCGDVIFVFWAFGFEGLFVCSTLFVKVNLTLTLTLFQRLLWKYVSGGTKMGGLVFGLLIAFLQLLRRLVVLRTVGEFLQEYQSLTGMHT
jgi:hypothetical protein